MSAEAKAKAGLEGRHAARGLEPTHTRIPVVNVSHDPGASTRGAELVPIESSAPVGDGSAPVENGHPSLSTDDVIDVKAIARLLRVGRNTIYALVSRNAIPHRHLGKQIRFHRGAIMRWLDSWSSQGAKEGQ